MPELIVFVLNDPNKTEEVLAAWLQLGVPGMTIQHSTGLRQEMSKHRLRDDLPLFPSLDDLLHQEDREYRTILAVVPDGFEVEALVAATERIVGVLDGPHTGILFTVPVTRAWGLNRP